MKKWYDIRAKADDAAELWIYESIGEDMWAEGTTAKSFVAELGAVKASQLDLHINSPGGSVFDGLAIYRAIQMHPAHVTTYVDGVAASIAGVVALAGDEVVMAKNALFMVHDPWGMAMGSSKDIRSYADVLDKVGESIVGVYQDKTLLDTDIITDLMAAETWMTAAEAMEYGFADDVAPALQAAACAFDFEPFGYKHPPVAKVATVDIEHDDDREPVAAPEVEAEAAEFSDEDLLRAAVGLSPSE